TAAAPSRRRFLLTALAASGPLAAARGDGDANGYKKIIYIRVGDPAPAFELPDDAGNWWRSARHYGRKAVVLYFYWGDFMPPCTRLAQGFRDQAARIAGLGGEVVAVSGDHPD